MHKFFKSVSLRSPNGSECSGWRVAVLLLAISVGTTGCSLDILREKLKITTGDDKEAIGIAAERLSELDQATYSFSDRFVTLIADST